MLFRPPDSTFLNFWRCWRFSGALIRQFRVRIEPVVRSQRGGALLTRLPTTHLRYLHAVCITVVIHCGLAIPIAAQDTSSPFNIPRSVSDFVVVSDGGSGTSIYLVDAETRGVYVYRSSGTINKRVNLSEFQWLRNLPDLRHPSAIAHKDGKLLICDKELSAIYQIEAQSLATKLIIRDGLLKDCSAVAVSDRGDIAVASDKSDTVVWYTNNAIPRLIDFTFNSPRRLRFNGNLLVMNRRGEVFQVEDSHLTVSKVTLPSKHPLNEPSDFGAFLNILYFATANGVVTIAQSSVEQFRQYDVPLPLLYENGTTYLPDRIFIDDRDLFVADNKSKMILRFARPVPVDIEFTGNKRTTTFAAIVLYEYLNSRNMLSVREHAVQRKRSVEEVLLDQQTILVPVSKEPAALRQSLATLVCRLNAEFCSKNNISVEELLKQKVDRGQTLRLPYLQIDEYQTSAFINLIGMTVDEYLRDVFQSASKRLAYKNNQFLKDNPRYRGQEIAKILKKKGEFRLPVMRWRANALVNAEDLEQVSTPHLSTQLSQYATYLFSRQRTGIKHASAGVVTNNIRSPLSVVNNDPEPVRKNRSDLKTQIHFPSQLGSGADLTDVYIGVAESRIDFNHPDFVRDVNESIWFQLLPDGSDLPRLTVPADRTVPSVTIGDPFVDSDHGTHVSGLIAASSNSIAPGLVPSLKGLVLLDTTNPGELHSLIQNAIKQGVFLYNFSFTFPNEAAMISLKPAMTEDWRDRLFIVAAGKAEGSENQDLESSAEAPIKWIGNSRNMIGVSAVVPAADGGWAWMNPYFDANGESRPGAKFGKRFVQLVAPGKNIFSSAFRNAYKKGSGTSQAVPQVTAAAAILFSQNITNPARIKARLMYTSDWDSEFNGKVYGGLLNVDRATWEPTLDIISEVSRPNIKKNIKYDGNPTILVTQGHIEQPDSPPVSAANMKIKFSNIFRIVRQPGPANLVRVFYLDDTSKLRILVNARLSGTINCKSMREWEETTKKFKDAVPCSSSFPITDVWDYVIDIGKVSDQIFF
jgi:subtilisin family serine protease